MCSLTASVSIFCLTAARLCTPVTRAPRGVPTRRERAAGAGVCGHINIVFKEYKRRRATEKRNHVENQYAPCETFCSQPDHRAFPHTRSLARLQRTRQRTLARQPAFCAVAEAACFAAWCLAIHHHHTAHQPTTHPFIIIIISPILWRRVGEVLQNKTWVFPQTPPRTESVARGRLPWRQCDSKRGGRPTGCVVCAACTHSATQTRSLERRL